MTADPVSPDVVGVNYYPGFSTVRFDDAGVATGVEAGAEGLDEVVRLYAARYGLPVMITETSRGGPLEERRAWLRESLATVERLRADGVPLVGYTWFPFTALIDWAYRESTTPVDEWIVQMGMVDLHRVPGGGALERHPTALIDDYAAAARSRHALINWVSSFPDSGNSDAQIRGCRAAVQLRRFSSPVARSRRSRRSAAGRGGGGRCAPVSPSASAW